MNGVRLLIEERTISLFHLEPTEPAVYVYQRHISESVKITRLRPVPRLYIHGTLWAFAIYFRGVALDYMDNCAFYRVACTAIRALAKYVMLASLHCPKPLSAGFYLKKASFW
jgi:hypothetical protein